MIITFYEPVIEKLLNLEPATILDILNEEIISKLNLPPVVSVEHDQPLQLKIGNFRFTVIVLEKSREKIPPAETEFLCLTPVRKENLVSLAVVRGTSEEIRLIDKKLREQGYQMVSLNEAITIITKGLADNAKQLAERGEALIATAQKLYIQGDIRAKKIAADGLKFVELALNTVEYAINIMKKAKILDKVLIEEIQNIQKNASVLKDKISRLFVI